MVKIEGPATPRMFRPAAGRGTEAETSSPPGRPPFDGAPAEDAAP